jgi:hypothetical protein
MRDNDHSNYVELTSAAALNLRRLRAVARRRLAELFVLAARYDRASAAVAERFVDLRAVLVLAISFAPVLGLGGWVLLGLMILRPAWMGTFAWHGVSPFALVLSPTSEQILCQSSIASGSGADKRILRIHAVIASTYCR